jgi:hypothetical protein
MKRSQDAAEVLLEPEKFKGSKTMTIKHGRLKVYGDKSGHNFIPSGWSEYGVAIAAFRVEGHTNYVCLSDSKAVL